MDSSGTLLGSVEIDVRANLDKLVSDFAAGRAQSQAFANDMGKVVGKNQQFAGSTAQLSQQLNSLVRQYDPLRVAQQKYTSDVAALQTAQKAGLIGQNEAIALQGAMGRAFQDTQKQIEGETVGLAGWARSTEHHLRAMRLLISFVGIDLAKRLGEFAIKSLEATAALEGQARELGLTTAELQEYKAVAGQVGLSSEEMVSAFKTLGANLDDLRLGKAGPFKKLLKELVVDIHDSAGKIKPTSQIFNELIDKLGQVGDNAQRQGAQVVAFGEAGQKMGDLVNRGSKGVNELRDAVRATGVVLSDEQIRRADETAKKLDQVKQVLSAKIAAVVVENAQAIDQLATALTNLAAISLSRFVTEISDLIGRITDLAGLLQRLPSMVPTIGGGSPELKHDLRGDIHAISEGIGSYDFKTGRASGFIGKAAEAIGLQTPLPNSVTVELPPARPADQKPKGPNIDLSNLLSGKDHKAKQAPFDQFESDLAHEKEQQLQLEKAATGDLMRQNEIEHEIIDLKLAEQIEGIKKQLHSKALSAGEAKRLIAEAKITAAAEKEAADRATRIAVIEQQNQYADEIANLTQQGLAFAKTLARTDDERKKIDLAILDSKQQQLVSEIDKEIALASEKHDGTRIAQLTEERKLLLANQVEEIKAFDLDHELGIVKFERELPNTLAEFQDAIKHLSFDLFNAKLQEAAQFAGDIGGAFGKAAGALARFENPLDVLRGLISDLADTFTKNVIEKPIADWATKTFGIPAAKQLFDSQLSKLAISAGGTALSFSHLDTALALATQSLSALTSAATAAAAAQGAGGAGGSGGGGILGTLLGLAGSPAGSFSVSGGLCGDVGSFDPGSLFTNPASLESVAAGLPGWGRGGWTGGGADTEAAGIVHKNEFVWDAGTTRRLRPVLAMLSAGQLPGLRGGLGLNPMRGKDGQQLHVHVGQMVFPGVTDERTARVSGAQAARSFHREMTTVVKKGMSTT